MATDFRIVERWPELFEGVSESTTRNIVNELASGMHEGWVPNRTDVADLVDFATGKIDVKEYQRRTIALVTPSAASHA